MAYKSYITRIFPGESNTFFLATIILLICFWCNTVVVHAQMFSVGGDDPGRIDIPTTGVYIGLEPADFDFTGNSSAPNPGRFEFNGSLLRLRLETPALDVYFGAGGSLTGLEGVSVLDVGVQAGYALTVLRREQVVIQIPLQITSGLTSVVSDQTLGSASQFNQGSLTGGVGGFVALRPSSRIRIQTGFVPSYGFSFATGGTFGGSLGSLEGRVRLFLDRVFGETGLSVGYDYAFDRYDIEENEFDYDLQAHSFLIGITF